MDTKTYCSDDLVAIQNKLTENQWLITCLCAAWCDTCQSYRNSFDDLQALHQDKCFAWIDIEDHANLVDDLDIENFPTILIEYQHKVLFLGTMLPDAGLVHRLVKSFEDSIQINGVDAIHSSIQNPLPAEWSLRRILENI
ncbi:thioredoxin family protein [Undibacterium flavidum]|uniref:Thioredoxin family protein n=1 Tax=Undibacterium flavidum TaxID=2762297 RepID=A0ABR6YEC9_9BURK|nr:thioredoxin family protein [Undibacterium flavidum]MBC3874920.1 thioredoxin family protein [Undibacterium flavidum]